MRILGTKVCSVSEEILITVHNGTNYVVNRAKEEKVSI